MAVSLQRSSTPTSTTSDLSDDPDMEVALREFDFLNRPAALGGSIEDTSQWGERDQENFNNILMILGCDWFSNCQSLGWGGTPVVDEGRGPGGGAWQVDQRIISQLKEEYRKERRGRKGMKSKKTLLPPSLPLSFSFSLSLWPAGGCAACCYGNRCNSCTAPPPCRAEPLQAAGHAGPPGGPGRRGPPTQHPPPAT